MKNFKTKLTQGIEIRQLANQMECVKFMYGSRKCTGIWQ